MTWLRGHALWLTCTTLFSLAAALSFWLRRRVRPHLPVALVLCYGAASDVIREAIGALVTRPERARLLELVAGDETRREAFSGAARAAFHVEQGLHLGWMAAVCWMAVECTKKQTGSEAEASEPDQVQGPDTLLVVPSSATADTGDRGLREGGSTQPHAARTKRLEPSARSAAVKVFLLWAATTALVARAYPALSGTVTARRPLAPVYAACHLGAALTCAVCFWRVYRRGDALVLRHLAVLVLGAAELLVVGSGPVAFGYWLRWDLARIVYGAAAAGLAWRTWVAIRKGENGE